MGALDGMTALVTGGGSGIGLGCAAALHRDGAHVTLMGRTESKLVDGAALLSATGERVTVIIGDTTNEDDVAAAVAAAAGASGRLDIAVAAAGTGSAGPITTTDLGTWNHVMATNLTGPFLLIKHAAAAMSGGGAIVAISSIASTLTHRYMAPYSVSKHGLDMLVRVAADELGRSGVRVNSVQPGLVPTDLTTFFTGTQPILDDYLAQMPLGRTGTTEDVGALVRFLAGPESGWITGVNVPVDGGHTLRRGPNLGIIFEQ
jgi:NAD(P)-dependent dehydrogenase (short-subunit alcohol dehydrogenase family)